MKEKTPIKKKKKTPMKNITINLPELYEKNIQKLIKMKVIASRSEAIRTALLAYLQKEFQINLKLFGYYSYLKRGEIDA